MTETIRIDKLLFFLRLAKSRSLAQGWAEAGHIRINGKRVEKGSASVRAGDIVTVPEPTTFAFKLLTVPTRRGPAPEAQASYQRFE